MSNNPRFDPVKELSNIRDQVNRVMEDTFSQGSRLPLDMYETKEHIIVLTGALLGLVRDSIDISISDGNQLTISLETTPPEDVNPQHYIRQERRFGPVSRTVPLPVAVLPEQASAKYDAPVLKITIPKAEPSSPKVVHIEPLE